MDGPVKERCLKFGRPDDELFLQLLELLGAANATYLDRGKDVEYSRLKRSLEGDL